ncbi:hypothetical protein EOL70_03430 [Leucothrix sargassi]|nr:hypothetical protein EOL70_03430 [Leucothrix sargassi]
MQDLIDWLTATPLNAFITNSAWVWPTMEMIHFFGLCLLFGSLLVIDLRMMGFARKVPITAIDVFITLTLIGFTLNLITGALFVVGDPGRYFVNIAFKIKMAAIVIAGLNAVFYILKVQPKVHAGLDTNELPSYAKYVAMLSLFLWTSVIILGRFIPYVEEV